jgi:tetratricopeptide (TPR) repeat protein
VNAVLTIIGLILTIGLFYKGFLEKPSEAKCLRKWRVGVFCSGLAVVYFIAQMLADDGAATKQHTESVVGAAVKHIDSTTSTSMEPLDELWNILSLDTGGGSLPIESIVRRYRGQMEIARLGVDSGAAAAKAEDYEVALIHSRYALLAAENGDEDSIQHRALKLQACVYQLMGHRQKNAGDSDSAQILFSIAAEDFRRAVLVTPSDSDAWFLAGFCEAQVGNHEEAIEHLTTALDLYETPGNRAQVWYKLAGTLSREGQHGRAIDAYDSTHAYDSTMSKSWNERGVSLVQQGRLLEALDSFTRAQRLNPEDTNIWCNRALVLWAAWCGDSDSVDIPADSVLCCLDSAISKGFYPGRAYTMMAMVCVYEGDTLNALKYCDSALHYDTPHSTFTARLRGGLTPTNATPRPSTPPQ